MRKSLKQVTGLRPRDLAAGGGLRLLAAIFLRQCGADAAGAQPGPALGRRAGDAAGGALRLAVRDTGAARRVA
jgi:hypothetical protein